MNIADAKLWVQIDACARAGHETHRALCLGLGGRVSDHLPWEELTESLKESAKRGVRCVLEGGGPALLRETWMKDERPEDWQTYFAPFDDVDPIQKTKYEVYIEAVRTMAKLLGLTRRIDVPESVAPVPTTSPRREPKREEVIAFEVRLLAPEDKPSPTESFSTQKLEIFREALWRACADVLSASGQRPGAENFEVLVRETLLETTV